MSIIQDFLRYNRQILPEIGDGQAKLKKNYRSWFGAGYNI
jgi:hypothetical protein